MTHASNSVGCFEPWSSWSDNTVILLSNRSEFSRLLLGLLVTAEENECIPWWALAKVAPNKHGISLNSTVLCEKFMQISLLLIVHSCLSKYKHALSFPTPSRITEADVTCLSWGLIFDLWPHIPEGTWCQHHDLKWTTIKVCNGKTAGIQPGTPIFKPELHGCDQPCDVNFSEFISSSENVSVSICSITPL